MKLKRALPGSSMILAALLVATGPAQGFLYEEHKDLSNEALRRAVNEAKRRCPDSRGLESLCAFAGASPFASDRATFGDLAALVDYTGYPWEVQLRRGFRLGDNPSGLQLLDLEYVAKLRGEFFRLLHASNLDTNHFQNNALVTYWYWHVLAIQTASLGSKLSPPELYRALILEAYAQHFLEDFFAPGHMMTPRQDLHAVASMTIHDKFNRRGAVFLVNPDALVELENLFGDPTLYARLRECNRLPLSGDGQLARPEGRDQGDFMAAVLARSTLDVLECWLCADGSEAAVVFCEGRAESQNRFLDWEFRPYRLLSRGSESPAGRIRYGEYEVVSLKNPVFGFPFMYSIQGGFETIKGAAGTTGRFRFEFEWIPLGSPNPGWREGQPRFLQFQGLPQFGLGVRYSHTSETGARSDGLGLELFFPITLVDLQLSISSDYRRYRGEMESTGRWEVGAKLEFGYGVIYAGIGVARSHHWIPPGRLEAAWSYSASLRLFKPHTLALKMLQRDRGVPFGQYPEAASGEPNDQCVRIPPDGG